MVSWFKRLFSRKPASAPAPVKAAVLGLTVSEPKAAPVVGRRLSFRGFEWLQRGSVDQKGKLTFVRETAVDGRPVPVEVQVLEADLETMADGTLTLRGRE